MVLALASLSFLACPSCKTSPLNASDIEQHSGVVQAGVLSCNDCARIYRIRQGVPFFAPWADDLQLTAARTGVWTSWARAHANYRLWHSQRWRPEGAARTRPLFEKFWEFASVSGVGVDIGGGRSINREWNPSATIWSVDPEASWALDPVPKFMGQMYKCWDEPFPFVQGIGEQLPIRTASMDFAIIQGVLDHVADPAGVICEARRVLKPGGTLWMMVTTTDLEHHVPLRKALRRRLGRAKANPLELLRQGPVQFFSAAEQGISEGHVSEGILSREALSAWIEGFTDTRTEDVEVPGIRQVFVRARRPPE